MSPLISALIVAATATLVAGGSLAATPAKAEGGSHAAPAAAEHGGHGDSGPACTGFGPQTPRDIDSPAGSNKRITALAPKSSEMNLCNIHFHKNAEHKAKAFSIYAGDGDGHGFESGYQCGISKSLTKEELAPTAKPVCKSEHGELKPGDTVEVHWVYTSCEIKGRDVKPGAGLGACITKTCANPNLRVEAQVFTLVNDSHAADFSQFDYEGNAMGGYQQPNALPTNTGTPVEFAGSTTGPSYNDQTCSPLAVSWSVRPQCAKLDINSLGEWCKGNAFGEDHAHGVRKLVSVRKLLSPIGEAGSKPSKKDKAAKEHGAKEAAKDAHGGGEHKEAAKGDAKKDKAAMEHGTKEAAKDTHGGGEHKEAAKKSETAKSGGGDHGSKKEPL